MDLDLAGWTLTDFEGTVTFPAGTVLHAGGRIVATRNATSYREDTLRDPDFTYATGDAPRMPASPVPRLANHGDELVLRDAHGVTADVFAWGDSRYAGPGWSGPPARTVPPGGRAVRAASGEGWIDTDTAADWNTERDYLIGQEDRPLASFVVAGVTAFLSPDAAAPALEALLRAGRRSAYLAVYELTSEPLAAELAAAARRGVDVRVLLEGSPVGGLDGRSWAIARTLSASGAQVRFLTGDPGAGIVARYRFLHAKYVVLDNATAVVSSENWGDHGFPTPPSSGNRGWHVAVRDRALAEYLAAAFLADFDPARRDSVALATFGPNPVPQGEAPSRGTYAPARAPYEVVGPIRAIPVLGPDHTLRTEAVLGALRSATRSIAAEVLLADPTWGEGPNPYLEALVGAARRGVHVRLLLDGTKFSAEDGATSNAEVVHYLNGLGRAESLSLEARLFPPGAGGVTIVHAKGFVIDGRLAFVSSLNWNRNSATRNREVGLIIESDAIASYFGDAFAWDWSLADGGGSVPLRDLALPATAVVIAASAVAWFRRWKRTRKEL